MNGTGQIAVKFLRSKIIIAAVFGNGNRVAASRRRNPSRR